MIPPTSIDGTDITGATIDGQDVEEITVDGQTVFTAETLPVAYSNLIAWYPFDSSFYGGSNPDDVTALFNSGQSGDSTAYDGTVNGATYQSSAGVTDINAGGSSGAFDFDGSNDYIETSNMPSSILGSNSKTLMYWVEFDNTDTQHTVAFGTASVGGSFGFYQDSGNLEFYGFGSDNFDYDTGHNFTTGVFEHHAVTYDGSTVNTFVDGQPTPTTGVSRSLNTASNGLYIGTRQDIARFFNGRIDDVRVYDTDLSAQQIQDVYDNTEP
jgi:hypothetical protein